MLIETANLIIRSWTPSDAEAFFRLTQDEGFRLFPITSYLQEDVESASRWIARNSHKYAVLVSTSDEVIGMGGLTPWVFEGEEMIDITYRLRTSAWGKGLGFELAKALVDYGFTRLGLREISATITPENLVSQKIVDTLGFVFDRQITLRGVETKLYRLTAGL